MTPTVLFKRYVGRSPTIDDVIKDCLLLVQQIETMQKTIDSLQKEVETLKKEQ